jgi:hypothetical protein
MKSMKNYRRKIMLTFFVASRAQLLYVSLCVPFVTQTQVFRNLTTQIKLSEHYVFICHLLQDTAILAINR